MFIIIFSIIVLLISVMLHEIAHGYAAYKLGDPTAKYEGRLSLNPLKHLDPVGSLLFPLFTLILTGGRGPIFGWAKPVPVNPYNFKDQKYGELKVAIAGPAMNFFVAIVFGLIIRFFTLPEFLLVAFSIIALYNIFWGIFNLLPIPPLDGSHILFSILPEHAWQIKQVFQQYGILILFLVIFFGLGLIQPLAFKLFYLISGQVFIF